MCNCGDPTLTAVGVEQPYRNRVRAGIEERYGSHTQGDGASAASRSSCCARRCSARGRRTRASLSALVVPWMTTWVTPSTGRARDYQRPRRHRAVGARALVGRDKSFGAHHLLWATAGLKLPTAPRIDDDAGFPYADDDQPGSGSWDPFVGVTYAWYSGALWSAYACGSYRYTTTGWHGYRRGMQAGWNAAVQAQPWTWGGIQLVVDGNWAAADRLGSGGAHAQQRRHRVRARAGVRRLAAHRPHDPSGSVACRWCRHTMDNSTTARRWRCRWCGTSAK